VTLGLLLAFRVNTAYDRYTEGRRLFQTVTTTIRNLARLIWINVPEKNRRDHVEKMRCVKLLLAFAVATKRHLRSEYGIDYPDCKMFSKSIFIILSKSLLIDLKRFDSKIIVTR
jgi:ion channel-forming bestrophin family protein